MTNAREIMAALAAHFDPDAVSWRVGPTTEDKSKGQALAYIDARDVMERLDQVMGADWQCEYVPMSNGTCCCRIGVKIDGEWRWRSNGAVNLVADNAKDEAKEMAEKGSYSDAFKRSAVLWGIGQYLYSIKSPWVAIVQKGRSYVIADSEQSRLRALLGGKAPESQKRPVEPAPPASRPTPTSNSAKAVAREMSPLNANGKAMLSFGTAKEMLSAVASPDMLRAWQTNYGSTSKAYATYTHAERNDLKIEYTKKQAEIMRGGRVAA